MITFSMSFLNCSWEEIFFGGGGGSKLECLGEKKFPLNPSRLNPDSLNLIFLNTLNIPFLFNICIVLHGAVRL